MRSVEIITCNELYFQTFDIAKLCLIRRHVVGISVTHLLRIKTNIAQRALKWPILKENGHFMF